jgi:hypothetical protein
VTCPSWRTFSVLAAAEFSASVRPATACCADNIAADDRYVYSGSQSADNGIVVSLCRNPSSDNRSSRERRFNRSIDFSVTLAPSWL